MLEMYDLIIGLTFGAMLIIGFVNQGKSWADKMIIQIAFEIESLLVSKAGQEKLDLLIDILKEKASGLPKPLNLIVKMFLKKEYIEKTVNSILQKLNFSTKNKF